MTIAQPFALFASNLVRNKTKIVSREIPDVILRHDIRKKGKSFYLDYHLNGERHKERIGFVSKNQANQARSKKIDELLNQAGITTGRKRISLTQAIEIHMGIKKRNVRESTFKKYRSNKHHLLEAIKEVGEKYFKDVATISEAQFQLLADTLKKRTKSDHRKNNLLVFLKAIENTAIRKGYMPRKISADIKTKKPDPKLKVQYFTKKELHEVWKCSDKFYMDYFKFFVLTGLRLGEFIHLKWDNVDFENKVISIEKYIEDGELIWEPKTKSSIRNVPLSAEAVDILRKQEEKNDIFVFTSKKGMKLHPNTVYGAFKRAAGKAKVSEDKTIHTLRHTFASQLAQKGVELYKIGTYLGHSKSETTRIYAHLSPSDDAEVLGQIEV
ncbi:MAG: hypothetical protein CL670_05890 [Balneola sp.]|nr:hypothetical protein [Balneola sp.]MBE78667.1 hypothetical protein [Balneola sp.]